MVAKIEAETGMPFDDYAKDILGKDMPERLPGESDEDFQRRVLKAITVEMIDPAMTFGVRVKTTHSLYALGQVF